MRPVIAVARRSDDGGPRDASWGYVRDWWERALGWPIHEAHHDDGLFNVSKARNAAARAAGDWDVILQLDADVVLLDAGQARLAAEQAIDRGQLTFAHDYRSELADWATGDLIAGRLSLQDAVARGTEKRNHLSNSSAVLIPRPLWETVRGYDERFHGWGWEDLSFRAACSTMGGGHSRVEGDVVHLWHPRSLEDNEGQPAHGQNWQLGERYLNIEGDADAMRALIARRDEPWWFCGCAGASMVMGAKCEACGKEAPTDG